MCLGFSLRAGLACVKTAGSSCRTCASPSQSRSRRLFLYFFEGGSSWSCDKLSQMVMTLSSVVRCRLLLAAGVDADLLDSGVLVLAVQGRFLPFPLPFAEGGGWSSSRPEMAGALFLQKDCARWLADRYGVEVCRALRDRGAGSSSPSSLSSSSSSSSCRPKLKVGLLRRLHQL